MPDATLPDTTVLTAAYWSPYVREQLVTTCTSATRPSGVEGRMIVETDTDLVLVYSGSGWVQMGGYGAWTSHTPQIDQGASTNIAKTTTYSKYTRSGKTITWNFDLTLSGSGTAGSVATLTLPVTAASTAAVAGGGGHIYDASTTTRYVIAPTGLTTTTVGFVNDASGSSAWGAIPSIALAASDLLRGSITYEAA